MVGTTAKPMRSRASSRSRAMSSTSAAMRGRTPSRFTSASKPARMLLSAALARAVRSTPAQGLCQAAPMEAELDQVDGTSLIRLELRLIW